MKKRSYLSTFFLCIEWLKWSITLFVIAPAPSGPGGATPYMGYLGMCGLKGYDFSVVLVKNRVSILAILVLNRVWL